MPCNNLRMYFLPGLGLLAILGACGGVYPDSEGEVDDNASRQTASATIELRATSSGSSIILYGVEGSTYGTSTNETSRRTYGPVRIISEASGWTRFGPSVVNRAYATYLFDMTAFAGSGDWSLSWSRGDGQRASLKASCPPPNGRCGIFKSTTSSSQFGSLKSTTFDSETGESRSSTTSGSRASGSHYKYFF